MTLYLSAPARHDFFRGGEGNELQIFDMSRSLYEFEIFEENGEQKAYFRLSKNYDAKQRALERYDTRIEYACEPANNHSYDKTKSVITTEFGIAAKDADGNWKVEKKAKVKYTENLEHEPELVKPESELVKPSKVNSNSESSEAKFIETSPPPTLPPTLPPPPPPPPPPTLPPPPPPPTLPPPPLPLIPPQKQKSNASIIVVMLIIVCGIVVYFLARPSVETIFNKGKESFETGNFTEAVTYFSKAIKRNSANAEFYNWRGRAYYEQKNYEAAAAEFKEAVRLSPQAGEYQYRLGETYFGMNRYESAVTAYTKAIGLESGNANYYFGRAGAYSAQKEYQRAIDDFTQAIRIDPNDARYYNSRGGDYRNLGDYDKAYFDHSKAIELNRFEAKYHNNRGVAQVLRKKYAEAIPDYSEAIRLAPNNARYYGNRGEAYFLIKDIVAGVTDYCMAARYDSGNASYRKNCDILEPVDSRDGQRYRAVAIGGKIWMAQNMNYRPHTGNSWCYDNNNSNCEKYGRLYDWNTAKAACLSGWHLPSRREWSDLVTAAGVSSVAGKKLKAISPMWNGENEYGFSALPGGYRESDGSFSAVGTDGSWWTATENKSSAYLRYMGSDFENVLEMDYEKNNGFSVRCILDAR